MEEHYILTSAVEGELVCQNSRFLARLMPISCSEEALLEVERLRKLHFKARHVVFAYVLESGNVRSSDDGEPSGTAGQPILKLLEGRGLCFVLAAVVRYFGGTLLGTGGLARAYSGAVSSALECACTERIFPCAVYKITLPYSLYQPLLFQLEALGGKLLSSDFSENITIEVAIRKDSLKDFEENILQNNMVALKIEKICEKNEVFPEK